MTRRELLQERYEDALFALLMDDVAVAQGKKALEEQQHLQEDPSSAVPLTTQQRCLRAIGKHYSKQNLHSVGRSVYKVVNKVALVTLIAVLLFTTAFATSSEFRANTLNLLIEAFDDHTTLRLDELNTANSSSGDLRIIAEWLPTGCTLASEDKNTQGFLNTYQLATGGLIEISAITEEGLTMELDTEDAVVEILEIQGSPALMSTKENVVQVTWLNHESNVLWEIFGENLSKSEVIQIAENVDIK